MECHVWKCFFLFANLTLPLQSWQSEGNPPQCHPRPRNKALLQDYSPPSSPNKALLRGSTPPKFNIAPENRESQKETHPPTIHFQGLC